MAARILTLIAFLALKPLAYADSQQLTPRSATGFICWPSIQDSKLVAQTSGDQIKIQVINPMGYAMMPQFDGPISPFLVPSLQQQLKELSGLSDHFELSWPKSSCRTFNSQGFQMDCSGEGRTSVSGIQAWLASTYKVTEESVNLTNVSYKFRFSLSKDGNTYFVTLLFPERSCRPL
jgi:hypothetical protein